MEQEGGSERRGKPIKDAFRSGGTTVGNRDAFLLGRLGSCADYSWGAPPEGQGSWGMYTPIPILL